MKTFLVTIKVFLVLMKKLFVGYYYYFCIKPLKKASARVHLPKNRRWQYTSEGRRLHNELKNLNKNKNNDSTEQCSSSMSNTVATRSDPFQFKLASYNLLAPSLLSQNFYLYRDLNQTYTDWNYRKAKLYDEIKQLRADVYIEFFFSLKFFFSESNHTYLNY